MKKDKRISKGELLQRLDNAQLDIPERWSAIEGQLDTGGWNALSQDTKDQSAAIPVKRHRVTRWVLAANLALVMIIAAGVVFALHGLDKQMPGGTVTTSGATGLPDAYIPQYPVGSKWVTMIFRSADLPGSYSAKIDRCERFNPATRKWEQVLIGLSSDVNAENHDAYLVDWKISMIDLEKHPLGSGLYRAAMKINTQREGASKPEQKECQAMFEIVASCRNPEFAMNMMRDPRAEVPDDRYCVDGLEWGITRQEAFAALQLTEDDFTQAGDTYTRKEPVRFRFPDVDAIISYTFTDGKLSAGAYDITSVSAENLYLVCGQIGGSREVSQFEPALEGLETEYITCLLSASGRSSSLLDNAGKKVTMRGGDPAYTVQVTIQSVPYGETAEVVPTPVPPIRTKNGIPQFPVDAKSILVTFRNDSLVGSSSCEVKKFEWLNPTTGKWERVLTSRSIIAGLGSNGIQFPQNSIALSIDIGGTPIEPAMIAGLYRATMTIYTVDAKTLDVKSTECLSEFELVAAG